MKPTVLLFDIDGTLITTGGAGRRAMERAFEVAHQRADALTTIRLDGMTDRLIARLGLNAIGVEATDAAIDALLVAYLRVLEEEVARIEAARYRLHLGMLAAVDAAHARGAAVGLGTGNLREGARVKLERVAVWHRFGFGGFGDDHEDRAALIRRGAERGAASLGVPLEGARVVIIGDTPKDVAAAQAMNAESIGVATGSFSTEQLRAVGATHAFATLADPGAIDALLGL
jgi:phosphoglycolate phosphatase-like HAD superfamily hydrolase